MRQSLSEKTEIENEAFSLNFSLLIDQIVKKCLINDFCVKIKNTTLGWLL